MGGGWFGCCSHIVLAHRKSRRTRIKTEMKMRTWMHHGLNIARIQLVVVDFFSLGSVCVCLCVECDTLCAVINGLQCGGQC